MQTENGKKPLSILMLALINVAAICSIRNWSLSAEYGFSSLFYYLAATLTFFIPCSLVSAELASAYPVKGGVFAWVKEAMGHRWGFLAIWLQWVENLFYYPIVLTFIAGTLAYAINPSLAQSPTYAFLVIVVVFWGLTLLNLRGMATSGWISTTCVVLGTIIPGVLIIALGFSWWGAGNPLQIQMSSMTFIPSFESGGKLSLLAGMLFAFTGMEMSAVHATDVQNPRKNFPRAIFLSALFIVLLSAAGTLAIAFVIPQSEISIVSSSIEAIAYFLHSYGLGIAVPLLVILVAIGAFGTLNTWIIGPSRGLLAAADNGELPPVFHKKNGKGMPVATLLIQAIVVSVVSLLFLYSQNVNRSFWMLTVLASQIYVIMYILMFISGIVLRYKQPDTKRPYRIPGGNIGMWVCSLMGLITCLFCFSVGFFPPPQLNFHSLIGYELFLIIGIAVFCAAPFVILAFRKESWGCLPENDQRSE